MNEETTQPKPRKALKIVGWTVLLLAAVIPAFLFIFNLIVFLPEEMRVSIFLSGMVNNMPKPAGYAAFGQIAYDTTHALTLSSVGIQTKYLNILTTCIGVSFLLWKAIKLLFRKKSAADLYVWKKCFQLCAILNALVVGSYIIVFTSLDQSTNPYQQLILTLSDGTELLVDVELRYLNQQPPHHMTPNKSTFYGARPYYGDDGWKYDPARKLYIDKNGRTATLSINEYARISNKTVYSSSSKAMTLAQELDLFGRGPFGLLFMFGGPLTITVLLGIAVRRQQRRMENSK